MVKIIFYSLVAAILFLPSVASSYDDQEVHPVINEKAAYQSQYFTDWITEYGFSDPNDILRKAIFGKPIKYWLRQGGTEEDHPLPRVLNHFHDPVYSALEWDKAGWGWNDSALVWAQKSDHSWTTARTTFYDALTTGSEEKFANTFQSLGQVMHLVSDMAVPAHVRSIQKTLWS